MQTFETIQIIIEICHYARRCFIFVFHSFFSSFDAFHSFQMSFQCLLDVFHSVTWISNEISGGSCQNRVFASSNFAEDFSSLLLRALRFILSIEFLIGVQFLIFLEVTVKLCKLHRFKCDQFENYLQYVCIASMF